MAGIPELVEILERGARSAPIVQRLTQLLLDPVVAAARFSRPRASEISPRQAADNPRKQFLAQLRFPLKPEEMEDAVLRAELAKLEDRGRYLELLIVHRAPISDGSGSLCEPHLRWGLALDGGGAMVERVEPALRAIQARVGKQRFPTLGAVPVVGIQTVGWRVTCLARRLNMSELEPMRIEQLVATIAADLGALEHALVGTPPALDAPAPDPSPRAVAREPVSPYGATDSPPALEQLGDYELVAPLGGGGFAQAFEARHRPTRERVFLKRVYDVDRDLKVAALQREMNIYMTLSRSTNANFLTVRDFFRDRNYIVLVTELAEGGDLAHAVQARGGSFDASEAKRVMEQIVTGVAYLHAHGVVHRDLKPENVLLSGGLWKIADFGIAKDTARVMTRRTFQGAGTVFYAPPEQLEGVPAHPSSDVYALGKVLTFLLTGQTDPDAIPWPSWKRLALDCTSRVPAERPTVIQLQERLSRLPG
jgi:hypothetical protein